MRERISAKMRQAVAERAQSRCEYCGVPDHATFMPHEPDHVVAIQHGGKTTLANLAYACFECNRFKGPNLSSIDASTGMVTPLYNPRAQHWDEHFQWTDAVIMPLTATGRATALLLRLNHDDRVTFRANLLRQGHVLGPQSK